MHTHWKQMMPILSQTWKAITQQLLLSKVLPACQLLMFKHRSYAPVLLHIVFITTHDLLEIQLWRNTWRSKGTKHYQSNGRIHLLAASNNPLKSLNWGSRCLFLKHYNYLEPQGWYWRIHFSHPTIISRLQLSGAFQAVPWKGKTSSQQYRQCCCKTNVSAAVCTVCLLHLW